MGAIASANTAGLVFAGGRATRMGGVNKALAVWEGRPMLDWVLERLLPQFSGPLYVSANRDADLFNAALGRHCCRPYAVLSDRLADFPGPLAAFDAASAEKIDCEWMLTSPCDTPLLPRHLLERFAAAQRAALTAGRDPDAFFAQGADGFPQPGFSVVRISRLGEVRAFIESGGRRLGGWLRSCGGEAVPILSLESDESLANLNSLDDMAAASAWLRQVKG